MPDLTFTPPSTLSSTTSTPTSSSTNFHTTATTTYAGLFAPTATATTTTSMKRSDQDINDAKCNLQSTAGFACTTAATSECKMQCAASHVDHSDHDKQQENNLNQQGNNDGPHDKASKLAEGKQKVNHHNQLYAKDNKEHRSVDYTQHKQQDDLQNSNLLQSGTK
eukprot:4911511-Amphidinium_carterae.1